MKKRIGFDLFSLIWGSSGDYPFIQGWRSCGVIFCMRLTFPSQSIADPMPKTFPNDPQIRIKNQKNHKKNIQSQMFVKNDHVDH